MTALPLPFRSNEGKYNFLGTPKLVNCYAEQQGIDAKAPLAIVPCAGMTVFSSPTDTPCRGFIALDDLDCIYSVHSNSVYKIVQAGTATRIGAIPGTDTVQMSRNQASTPQISIHCTAGEYYIENDLVKLVTDTDLPTAVSQDHVGGYTAYGISDRRVFLSSINACQTIDGTDYAQAEQSPDPLVRVKADRGNLFIFKKRTIEVWRDTGNADFPFEPLVGSTAQKGLLSANGLAPSDNTLMFPGDDSIVYRLNGYSPQRISTHAIERAIEGDTSASTILGFAHAGEGHSFYTLTGSTWTRSYDSATQTWHSRESYNLGKWRAQFSGRIWGYQLVGDSLTGNIYRLDKDAFTEGGDPLIWGVRSPTMHAFPQGGIIDAVYLDLATGVGLVSGQGSAPKVMLSWSVDGGNTFRSYRELSLGAIGSRVRVTTRRLGRFGPLGVVFDLRISDPVIRAFVNMDCKVRPLRR